MSFLFTRSKASDLADDDTALGKGCIAWDPTVENDYNYKPNLGAGVVYTIFFSLSLIAHLAQSTIKRKWWYMAFALGALGELMGWASRLASHYCPYNDNAFLIQISILIISPCFYSAGLYYMLAVLISRHWGPEFSPISPKLYLWIFVTFDLVSIAIQGTGGGLASAATTQSGSDNGAHIMLAGIAIQLASMGVFMLLWFIIINRVRLAGLLQPDPKLRLGLWVWTIGAMLIVIRNIYRCVELAQGWNGFLITRENYFIVFDGMLMVIFPLLFNVVHPAWYIRDVRPTTPDPESVMEEGKSAEKGHFSFSFRNFGRRTKA